MTDTPDSPERVWIEDERHIGGAVHVHNDEPQPLALQYVTEYVRKDLCRADTRPAPAAVGLQWEVLHTSHGYRAAAPLFGSIRVERYGEGPWQVNWSVPGYTNQLIEADFDSAADAMDAADKHVAAALSPAPVEGLTERMARAMWKVNCPDPTFDEALEGERNGVQADANALDYIREMAEAAALAAYEEARHE